MRVLILLIVAQTALALAQEPVDFAGWMRLGARENSYGQYRRAALAYERAIAIEPSNPKALFGLGDAHAAQFIPANTSPDNLRLEELAIRNLRKAVKFDPANAKAMVWLAAFPMYRAQWDEARVWYENAAAADALNAVAWAGLGHVLIARSLPAYRKARTDAGLDDKSEELFLLDAAGRAELRSHIGADLDAAVNALQRALEIEPKNSRPMASLYSALVSRAETRVGTDECEQDIAAAKIWLERSNAA